MVALTGKETLQVQGQDATGQPAASTFLCSTADIAALASLDTTGTKITALNTVGAGTITAAGIAGKFTSRGGAQGGSAFTDTTDTAANIIATLPTGASTGTSFTYTYTNLTNATATITGGTGVTVSKLAVVPSVSWVKFLVTYTAANTVTMVGVESGQFAEALQPLNTSISTVGAGTLTGAGIAGGLITRSGSTAAYSDATDTADNIIAAYPNAVIGNSWTLIIKNTVGFVQTITNGTGVTVSNITAIPPNTAAMYLATYTAASTVTLVGIGLMPLSAASAMPPLACGSAKTVTAENFGQTILLDTASGSVLTLPAATGSGGKLRIVVTATVTSNSHKVLTAPTTDVMQGLALGITNSTGVMKSFQGLQSSAYHSLQMPSAGSTPSGGFQGDTIEIQDVGNALWQVVATYGAGTTPTTMFSTATS